MPLVARFTRPLVAIVLVVGAAACGSGGDGSGGPAPLHVTCPAPTRTAFAQTRFTTAVDGALGLADGALYEPARAGRFDGSGARAVAARAAADRAVRTARRDLRRAATELRTGAGLCRAMGAPLERLDAGLAAFPGAMRDGTAAAAATRLRDAAGAVIAAAARRNLTLTPDEGATP